MTVLMTFLVANASLEIVLRMPFLTLSGADVDFFERELRWRTYTTKEALSTTRRVELVGKKEFAGAELDPEHETYVVHVGSVSSVALPSSFPLALNVHLSRRPQIAGLIAEEAPTKVPDEYVNFAFSPDWFPNSTSTLGSMIMLSSWSMPTGSSDHPSYPQMLPSFLTGSRTNSFNCASEVSIT